VYYRVYTGDGAIPSKSAFDPTNPFIGRITARSVPPPHIVGSLKRCVAGTEQISEDSTRLYLNQSARSPLDSSTKVTIRGVGNDPGKTLETAFALIIVGEMTPEGVAAVDAVDLSQYREGSEYLYYQLYSRTAEDVSKVAFEPTEPSIGRVEKLRICPPLYFASIKRCVAKMEGKPIYAYGDLYANISAEKAIGGWVLYASVADGTAGSTKENPMVLVQPERRRGLMNRPFKRIKSRVSPAFTS
ncbi:hypothetical protein DFH06DRAFT_1003427, partial [Mycena polygramma]